MPPAKADRVLGPLEVLADNGDVVNLGRRRQRALLAVLVIEANRPAGTAAAGRRLSPGGG